MPRLVVQQTVSAKDCAAEHLDVLVKAFDVLATKYREQTGKLLPRQNVSNALLQAGAKMPRLQVVGLVHKDFPYVSISVYDDGSVQVKPVKVAVNANS